MEFLYVLMSDTEPVHSHCGAIIIQVNSLKHKATTLRKQLTKANQQLRCFINWSRRSFRRQTLAEVFEVSWKSGKENIVFFFRQM